MKGTENVPWKLQCSHPAASPRRRLISDDISVAAGGGTRLRKMEQGSRKSCQHCQGGTVFLWGRLLPIDWHYRRRSAVVVAHSSETRYYGAVYFIFGSSFSPPWVIYKIHGIVILCAKVLICHGALTHLSQGYFLLVFTFPDFFMLQWLIGTFIVDLQ